MAPLTSASDASELERQMKLERKVQSDRRGDRSRIQTRYVLRLDIKAYNYVQVLRSDSGSEFQSMGLTRTIDIFIPV